MVHVVSEHAGKCTVRGTRGVRGASGQAALHLLYVHLLYMQEASTRGPYGHLLRGDMGEWPVGTVRTYSAEAQAEAPGRMCRHGVAKGESTLNPNPNPKP